MDAATCPISPACDYEVQITVRVSCKLTHVAFQRFLGVLGHLDRMWYLTLCNQSLDFLSTILLPKGEAALNVRTNDVCERDFLLPVSDVLRLAYV